MLAGAVSVCVACQSSAPASPSAVAAPSPWVVVARPSPSAIAPLAVGPLTGARVINFDATDHAFTLPDTVSAGTVTLVMRNSGRERHHAQILRLNAGVSTDEVVTALRRGQIDALGLVTFAGGTGTLDPDAPNEEITLALDPGDYVVVCTLQSADGTPHLARGMLKPLRVTPPRPATAVGQPDARVTVTLRDFSVDARDAPVPSGRVPWRIANDGPQAHEIEVARVPDGTTIADLVAVLGAPASMPAGYASVGGVQGIAAGASAFVTLDLPTGQYALYCTLPDLKNGGIPHLREGMVTPITVQ